MSFSKRLEAARMSCCISARWETTKVADRPRLNNCTAVPITIMPTAIATRSSIKLKSRPEFFCVRPMFSSLPIPRNESVENILSGEARLWRCVLNRDGDSAQRSDGNQATTRGEDWSNRDLPLVIGQGCARVRRAGVGKNSSRTRLLQNLRATGSVVRRADDSIDSRTIHGLEPGKIDSAHHTSILNLGPGHVCGLARGQDAFDGFVGELLGNAIFLRRLRGGHCDAEHAQHADQSDGQDDH